LKILLLSDANSVHTLRWAESLKIKNFNLLLFSFFEPNPQSRKKYKELGINVISPNLRIKIKNLREPNLTKIKYLSSILLLRKSIKNFQPKFIHAHYASSYGILAFLSRFKPFILSVWGSDIYDFPYKNFINKFLIKRIINSANIICSTSNAMKKIIKDEYGRTDVKIIPFGIDFNFFKPNKILNKTFTVGTIKSIEQHNGIDCLLDAAKLIIHDYKKDMKFLIVGDGSLKKDMQQKAIDLGLEEKVEFTGFIPHDDIKKYYFYLSIFIAVSKRESFGVSVLEAASCEIPAITSNIGGLIEVNSHNKTGIVINVDNPRELAESIIQLYNDKALRKKFGINARKRVIKKFNWEKNVNQMTHIYKNIDKSL